MLAVPFIFALFLLGISCYESDLLLVHVIFRHGARVPTEFYSNDPNKNHDFYPITLGGLTNEGKVQAFELGRFLRRQYNELLGDLYTDDAIHVRSTKCVRTRNSAALVLAGLMPPKSFQIWNNDLLWQPIPIDYKELYEEDLFHREFNCQMKDMILDDLPNRQETQEIYIKPYQDLFRYVERMSGNEIESPLDLALLYFNLVVEQDLNMTVPEWVHSVFPHPMESVSALMYPYINHDERLKIINSGYLLEKIMKDSISKINGALSQKMFLYSGHERTIGFMLNALNVPVNSVPSYSSALIFELHLKKNRYFFKIRYKNDTKTTVLRTIQMNNCNIMCPFEEFVNLYRHLIPTLSMDDACSLKLS